MKRYAPSEIPKAKLYDGALRLSLERTILPSLSMGQLGHDKHGVEGISSEMG